MRRTKILIEMVRIDRGKRRKKVQVNVHDGETTSDVLANPACEKASAVDVNECKEQRFLSEQAYQMAP